MKFEGAEGQNSLAPTLLAREHESGRSLKATWQRSANRRRTCPAFLWVIITQKSTESMSCPRCRCCPFLYAEIVSRFRVLFSDGLATSCVHLGVWCFSILFFFCFLFGYFLVPVISLNKQVNSSIGLPGTLPQKQYTWVHWLQDIFEQGEASSVLTWYIVHVARCERSTLCTGSLSMSAAFIES